MLEIIKTRLEEEGLNLNDIPPSYYVESFYDIVLDLFDEEHGVGIVHTSWLNSEWTLRSARCRNSNRWIAKQFAEQTNDITIGVFNTPGESFGGISGRITAGRLNTIEANFLRFMLFEVLHEQLDDFIAQLQDEGIID